MKYNEHTLDFLLTDVSKQHRAPRSRFFFFAYACAKGRLNLLTSCLVLTLILFKRRKIREKNEKTGKRRAILVLKKGKKKNKTHQIRVLLL